MVLVSSKPKNIIQVYPKETVESVNKKQNKTKSERIPDIDKPKQDKNVAIIK